MTSLLQKDALFSISFSKAVPGVPGEDYPIFAEVPESGFTCDGQVDGGESISIRLKYFQLCTQWPFIGHELDLSFMRVSVSPCQDHLIWSNIALKIFLHSPEEMLSLLIGKWEVGVMGWCWYSCWLKTESQQCRQCYVLRGLWQGRPQTSRTELGISS